MLPGPLRKDSFREAWNLRRPAAIIATTASDSLCSKSGRFRWSSRPLRVRLPNAGGQPLKPDSVEKPPRWGVCPVLDTFVASLVGSFVEEVQQIRRSSRQRRCVERLCLSSFEGVFQRNQNLVHHGFPWVSKDDRVCLLLSEVESRRGRRRRLKTREPLRAHAKIT